MAQVDNRELSTTELSELTPHAVETSRVIDTLKTNVTGLSQNQITARQASFGPNKLNEVKNYSVWSLVIGQFNSFLVYLLIGAGILSLLVGEILDAGAIFAIILVNGLLGFIQEFKAEQSLAALKKIETAEARVIRDGQELTIPAAEIVPGDILLLSEGQKIPADARLIEAHTLMVDESMLTGESTPTTKDEKKVFDTATAVADRVNMVFSTTLVTRGRGKAVAVLTGQLTEIGKIAEDIQTAPEEETPLQKALGRLGKILGLISIGAVIPGLIIGVLTNRELIEMIMLAISLAVAAIPEGLPIVVTIALALGIRRMARVNVLIRRLSTAETLGGTQVICSDKTGTITHNEMTISSIYVQNVGFFDVSGSGYETQGEVKFNEQESHKLGLGDDSGTDQTNQSAQQLIESAALASDATLEFGDPTERAFIVALHKFGSSTVNVADQYRRIDEVPFSSEQKFMAVLVDKSDQTRSDRRAIIKGAPATIYAMCQLTDNDKEHLGQVDDHLSAKGLRVLAVAEKITDGDKLPDQQDDYRFLGLAAMSDPPRESVVEALQTAQRAGVRAIMLTGDHQKTAAAIAGRVGLESQRVVTGVEIDGMDDTQFNEAVSTVNVFARVSPQHKLRVLEALQARGLSVAMTGDGVNDAPAVKRADIGIAVGAGTDLTKGISDMILLDNDFSTIVKGIREGRRIFFNIKKFVKFLISANAGEVVIVFAAILFNTPLPLLPLQILWLNLVTDSLPALALTGDIAAKDIMDHKPYRPQKEIIGGILPFTVLIAVVSLAAVFGLFLVAINQWGLSEAHARTMAFTTLVLFEFVLVFAIRSPKSALSKEIFSNLWLWLAVGVGTLGQLAVIYHPVAQEIFKTVGLSVTDWLRMLPFIVSGFVVIEILEVIKRNFPRVGKFLPVG